MNITLKFSTLVIFILLIFSTIKVSAQSASSKNIANYDIYAELNDKQKTLTGEMTLCWTNTSADTLTELQFHLYMNAFKNSETTFMAESSNEFLGQISEYEETSWGWIDIKKLSINSQEDLVERIKYISPDDSNPNDKTVISVPAKNRIVPGQSVNVQISFKTKLPQIFARAGYRKDFIMAGQWFPKIGVYQAKEGSYGGEWNCHQYHANSEFYSDFGIYNVEITIPEEYIVGATGTIQKTVNNTDGTKTVIYKAESVIDFAWTASKRFVIQERKWKNVSIQLYLQPEHKKLAERHFDAAIKALEYLDNILGEYPYPTLSIIDPPLGAYNAYGMEYPMLITAGTFSKIPKGIRLPEDVVIHEIGHQYFMGIIATNEFENAWMDEGFTSYFESEIMDKNFGKYNSLIDIAGVKVGSMEMQRSSYVHSEYAKIYPSSLNSWEYIEGGYSIMSYSKPATFLKTLENILGKDKFHLILKEYFKRYKFRHPSPKNFIDLVHEMTYIQGQKQYGFIERYFDQVLEGTNTCDYMVKEISNRLYVGSVGTFDSGESKIIKPESSVNENNYRSQVTLFRQGEIILPVELLITFDNGTTKTENWSGEERTKSFVYDSPNQIVSAKIDPNNKILLDINLNNNSKTFEKENAGIWKYLTKFLFWFQNLLQTVAFFI